MSTSNRKCTVIFVEDPTSFHILNSSIEIQKNSFVILNEKHLSFSTFTEAGDRIIDKQVLSEPLFSEFKKLLSTLNDEDVTDKKLKKVTTYEFIR